MPTTSQPDVGHVPRHRETARCLPLHEIAGQNLYQQNAFRIAGLPVDASAREIDRQFEKLIHLAEFKKDGHSKDAAFPIIPPPGLDDLRAAKQRLKDPQKRLLDEFFWFWPQEFGQSKTDPAVLALLKGDSKTAIDIWTAKGDDIIAQHNLALVQNLVALDWELYALKNDTDAERRVKIQGYWKGTFKRWSQLITNEDFWAVVEKRIQQLNEPNLKPVFATEIRASLPEAFAMVNADLAMSFAETGKLEAARSNLDLIRDSGLPGMVFDKVVGTILLPDKNRLTEHVRRAVEQGKKEPADGAKAALELLRQAEKARYFFDLFTGKENVMRHELFDEVAYTANILQVSYHKKTGDELTCLDILNKALPFAYAKELTKQILDNIEALKKLDAEKHVGREFDPLFALLNRLVESNDNAGVRLDRFKQQIEPSLVLPLGKALKRNAGPGELKLLNAAAIALQKISKDAWNKHKDMTTAIAAIELAFKYAMDKELEAILVKDNEEIRAIETRSGPVLSKPLKQKKPYVQTRYGDAAGEYQEYERGQYSAEGYVAAAFIIQLIVTGIISLSFVTNILGIACSDTACWIVGGVGGVGISLLYFWNRWRCIETLSSRACSGIVNLSLLYVPVVALLYGNWRALKKVWDSDEWENTPQNKATRLGIVVSLVVLALGFYGELKDEAPPASPPRTMYSPPPQPAIARPSPPATAAAPTANDSPPPTWATTTGLDKTPADGVPSAPPATPPAPAKLTFNADSIDSKTYRVPSYRTAELNQESLGIEADRAVLKQYEDDMDALDSEIKRDRIYLDRSSQYEVDRFNEKVDRYNALAQKAKVATAAFNKRVENYNAKLRQYSH